MFWPMTILVVVTLALFALTWLHIHMKADHNQYAATCGRFDDYRRKVDELVNNHSGYGPTSQHMAALDQIVTLQLYPKAPGGQGDGHFYIPSPETYKTGYSSCVEASNDAPMRSTERSITLRELLNRLLKDATVELVYPVDADWKFVDKPTAPPFVIQMPAFSTDNRKHPLDGIAFAGPVTEPANGSLGAGASIFSLFNDQN